MAIRAYLLAVEGIAYEAIARAARMFLSGEVRDHNKAFAPSCAEFSDQCRYQQLVIDAERRPKIEAKQEEDNSPRVAPWKLRLLMEALQGSNEARAKLREMYPHMSIEDVADIPVNELEA